MIHLSAPNLNERKPRIVVFGVGGAGGNAVNNMIDARLQGVEFVVANTDAQALLRARTENRLQLGATITEGLGAGARPEVGQAAAQESTQDITDILDGAHMVFVAAGMGGGTGTGAAPVIARAARERGILTVAVVTKPFHFEGQRRMEIAEVGVQELRKHVDTLIVIPNQNLFRIANDRTTFAEAFQMADQVLYSGVRGVTDLMVMPGLINLDFADVRTVMAEMGTAMMGNGEATGPNRALDAAHAAITNPLLDIVSMKGARGVLINITGGLDMTLYEVDAAANEIRAEVDPQANIILGSTFDDQMEGFMRVSVVATGIDDDAVLAQHTVVPNARRAADGYGGPVAPRRNIMDQKMLSGAIDSLGGPTEESYADDPFVADRPSFGPAGQEEEEAPARKGGFGWFSKRKEEPEPKIEAREPRRLPEPDAALDEELEIPAFLRRQMTQR